MQYDLGQRMGLEGTPMILAADGTQLGGYLPPAQLRAALDKLAGESRAGGEVRSHRRRPLASVGTDRPRPCGSCEAGHAPASLQ